VGLRRNCAILLSASLLSSSAIAAPDWEKKISRIERGAFPNARPLQATYNFGWNEMVAATAEIHFSKSDGRLQLQGTGQTIGVVRALWRFDVHHRAVSDAATLRPVLMNQVEEVRGKTITTDLVFEANGVVRTRTDTKSKKPPKPKTFTFPGLLDLHSALLYIRSQPLDDGNVHRIAVYPATSAYLATITVAGRETITVGAGTYKAIKLDLQSSKIGKKRELEPHKKFRRASVWISDDADRLLLRIEASVFVGTVFAELQSVRFGDEKS
jgi:Protein of unknown function (DUF3108)